MHYEQISCKVFVRKKNNEQNNIHVDNRGMSENIPQNRLKIYTYIFPSISKQTKRI